VEIHPEVTFEALDTGCQFKLDMLMRFHNLGAGGQNDLYELESLVTCTVTVEEDWSQVIDVQVGR
jgi:hypothetical protein